VFINTHTHKQIYDAQVELVSLSMNSDGKANLFSLGIHPWHINKETMGQELENLKAGATQKNCLAIGECGLDKVCDIDFKLQEEVFMEQIKIANQLQKPLIIHCVKAFNELLNCLNFSDNKVPVIVHGFNNNENIARLLVEQGILFSFGKALLGYESNAAKCIIQVGRKNFFLETDTADVSIKYIYKKASELLHVNEEILKQQLAANFERVFNFELDMLLK
jgi:TatD DNase family protein